MNDFPYDTAGDHPDGFLMSRLEATGYFYGILLVCRQLESLATAEGGFSRRQWSELRNWLLKILALVKIDHFLRNLDPNEKLFEQSIAQRAQSDAECFKNTFLRVLAIRKERGEDIAPLEPESTNEDSRSTATERDGGTAHYSPFENFNRLCGMFEVLDFCEQSVALGSLSLETHIKNITVVLDLKDGQAVHWLLEESGDLAKVAPRGALVGGPLQPKGEVDEPTLTWLILLNRIRRGEEVFKELRKRFVGGHDELSQRLAWNFVNEFLKDHTASEPEGKVREILFTIQKRLQARHEAAERGQYDRIKTIDENVEHLFATLAKWGIKGSTYDEALKAYERRFVSQVPSPPTDKIAEIRSRIQSRIGDAVRLQQDRDAAVKENPEFEEFIRREYQKEIDRLRR